MCFDYTGFRMEEEELTTAALAAVDQATARGKADAREIAAFFETLTASGMPAALVKEIVIARYGWVGETTEEDS